MESHEVPNVEMFELLNFWFVCVWLVFLYRIGAKIPVYGSDTTYCRTGSLGKNYFAILQDLMSVINIDDYSCFDCQKYKIVSLSTEIQNTATDSTQVIRMALLKVTNEYMIHN